MYTVNTDCAGCSTARDVCLVRALCGQPGLCCRSCDHAERRVEVVARRVPPLPPAPDEPLSAEEEDRVVEAFLDRAGDDDGVERGGQVNVGAMRGLARSRGVPLEAVVRHAYRGDLAEVVKRPVVPG